MVTKSLLEEASNSSLQKQFFSSQTSCLKFKYFMKIGYKQKIILLEKISWNEDPTTIPLKNFLSRLQFIDLVISNNQKFYEFTLVDTGSISIKHYPHNNDLTQIVYSVCQICQILTQDQWDHHSNQNKKNFQNFSSPNFHY